MARTIGADCELLLRYGLTAVLDVHSRRISTIAVCCAEIESQLHGDDTAGGTGTGHVQVGEAIALIAKSYRTLTIDAIGRYRQGGRVACALHEESRECDSRHGYPILRNCGQHHSGLGLIDRCSGERHLTILLAEVGQRLGVSTLAVRLRQTLVGGSARIGVSGIGAQQVL